MSGAAGDVRRLKSDGGTVRLLRVNPPDDLNDAGIDGLEQPLSRAEAAVLVARMRAQMRVSSERAVLRAAEVVRTDDGLAARRFAMIATRSALILVAHPELSVVRRFLGEHPDGSEAADGIPGLIFGLYALLTEQYHAAAEELVDATETVAQRVLVGPDRGLGHATFKVRRDAYALRIAVGHARSVFAVLVHERPHGWGGRAVRLFREIADRIEPIYEDVETVRESLGETVEAYSSVQSNSINEVMKLFTLISLLFLPPTLIASIYGMNFRIPEYAWPNGYAYALGLMAVLTGGIVFWARLRNWLR